MSSDSLPEDELVCPCCHLPQKSLRKGYYCSEPICRDCIIAWYDGETATTDAALIGRRSRLRQGYVMEVYEP